MHGSDQHRGVVSRPTGGIRVLENLVHPGNGSDARRVFRERLRELRGGSRPA